MPGCGPRSCGFVALVRRRERFLSSSAGAEAYDRNGDHGIVTAQRARCRLRRRSGRPALHRHSEEAAGPALSPACGEGHCVEVPGRVAGRVPDERRLSGRRL